jgi:hypothetical protein
MLEGWLAILRASPAKVGPARRLPLAPPAGDSSPGAASRRPALACGVALPTLGRHEHAPHRPSCRIPRRLAILAVAQLDHRAAAVGARHVDDRLLRDQQVHRSTIVNLAHLAGTRRDDASRLFLSIAGWDDELPVSRAYVHLFKPM